MKTSAPSSATSSYVRTGIKGVFSLAFALLSFKSAIAQSSSSSENLKFVIKKVTANYSGYSDKVNPANKKAFESFTDSLIKASELPKNAPIDSGIKLINKWLGFFKDGHMYLINNIKPVQENPETVRKQFANWPQVNYGESDFKNYLANKKKPKPLEGIWATVDGAYKVGIINEDGYYKGFIIKADSIYWLPKQLKFNLSEQDMGKAIYYLKNHLAERAEFSFENKEKTILQMGKYGSWYKLNPQTNQPYNPMPAQRNEIVSFKKLSNKTNLLTIKAFDSYYIHTIDSVVKANDALLNATDNLVIDVRNNGGGADAAFRPLRKYLYTNAYNVIGVDFYCTSDNIQFFKKISENTDFSENDRASFKTMVDSMTVHLNGYWSPFKDNNKEEMDAVLTYPKKVVVLMNEGCASTTEQFIMDPVSNSTKAIKMGRHTGGVLDYASVNGIDMPYPGLAINYPTAKSKRIAMDKGIDNKGIAPDIKLSDKTDWIEYAQKYLEK